MFSKIRGCTIFISSNIPILNRFSGALTELQGKYLNTSPDWHGKPAWDGLNQTSQTPLPTDFTIILKTILSKTLKLVYLKMKLKMTFINFSHYLKF